MAETLNKSKILLLLADHSHQLTGFGVISIGLFGSFTTGKDQENSDVDLLVDIRKDRKTFKNFMALAYYLEDLLGKKVDLITQQSLSPYIGPHILKNVTYAAIAG